MERRFREYELDQLMLMPPSSPEWVPEDHVVHFLSDVADGLDLSAIYDDYQELHMGRHAVQEEAPRGTRGSVHPDGVIGPGRYGVQEAALRRVRQGKIDMAFCCAVHNIAKMLRQGVDLQGFLGTT